MRRIILTGGGTAGHVMPNLALLHKLRKDWEIFYIGSYDGIEKEIIGETDLPYYPIASGKLRRYFSLKNFTDPFRVLQGIFQALRLIRKIRPDLVFSKGGFVSVPVAVSAWLCRIPVILHESDLTPGLANRLSLPFATKICATFPETLRRLPAGKGVLTGNPIRPEFYTADKEEGLSFCGFSQEQPVLAVAGGSLGSKKINDLVRSVLPELLQSYQVVHICGKGNIIETLNPTKGYRQFEFIGPELPSVLAAADLCVSRAGANFLFELLALKKPHLLIPLSKEASRGDQILNADSFKNQGFSMVLSEEEATDALFLERINSLYKERARFIEVMEKSKLKDSTEEVMRLITEIAR